MKNARIFSYACMLFAFLLGCASCGDNNDNNNDDPNVTEVYQGRSVKRGVSYGFQIPTDDAALLGKAACWFYNWDSGVSDAVNTATVANNIAYVPMAWNGSFNADKIRATKAAHPECQYILAFNEPNLTDQANMTPEQAAQYWPALKSLATELNMKLISPAMNYGTLSGYSDPIVWLDEFFTLVPVSDIDGIAVHCYMGNASALAWYIGRFKKYNKPIWLTEFCAWETTIKSATDQMKYMSDAINYLECEPAVYRYAWFIPRAGGSVDSYPYMQLLTKTSPYDLTPLGKVFANLSTQDKSIYYPEYQKIPAEHYSSLNMAETVKNGTFSNSVHLRPTTDESGDLEVFDFYSGYWLEYQVNITSTSSHSIQFRYASASDATVDVSVDGTVATSVSVPSTTAETVWTTASYPLNITTGKHTVRLSVTSGGVVLNWLSIVKQK